MMQNRGSQRAGYFVVHFSIPGRHGRRHERRIIFASQERDALDTLPANAVVHRVRWRPRTPMDRQWILSAERIGFLRAFGSFIQAGESPARALARTIDLSFAMQPAKRTQMQPALDVLSNGGDFLQAAGLTGIFDAPILGLLAAGAQTKIREVIGALHDYLATRQKLYAMAAAQLSLVVLEFLGAMSLVVYLEVSGFDMILGLADQAQSASQAARLDFLSAVDLCRALNGAVLILLSAGTGLLAFLYVGLRASNTAMEAVAGRLLARVPLLNDVAADLGLAETFGIFGRLLMSGIPWQQALQVVLGSAPAGPVRAYWTAVKRLGETTALSGAEILVQAEGLLHPWEGFPLLANQTSTPDLGRAVLQLGEDRKEATERSSRRLVRSVSTAMVVLMTGVIVMVLYLGVVQSQLSMADMNGVVDSSFGMSPGIISGAQP